MDNFETTLSSIDDRVKAYSSRLADIKNALKKKFEEAFKQRMQNINALHTILDRHNREGFAFSVREAGADDETSYEIDQRDDGLHVKIDDKWTVYNSIDSRLADAVDSLDNAEDLCEYLTRIDENNQRVDEVLKAYLQLENRQAERREKRFAKLLNECC